MGLTTLIYRITPDGAPEPVDDRQWQAALRGELGLPATRPGELDVLLARIQRHPGDPPQVLSVGGVRCILGSNGQVDRSELDRWESALAEPLPAAEQITDARERFFRRVVAHRFHWTPDAALCAAVAERVRLGGDLLLA